MKRSIFLLIISYFSIINLPAVEAVSISSVVGKKYKIFIYAPYSNTSVSTVTFNEDSFLEFSAYEGTGSYFALGGFFTGVYWAPDYYEKSDLILILSGFVIDPYLLAAGVVIINADISKTAPWICQGHEIY